MLELSEKLLDVRNQSSLFTRDFVNSSLIALCGSRHNERPDAVLFREEIEVSQIEINMTTYNNQSMVKKEHARIIAEELIKFGSKTPKDLDLNKEHCLANLLSLATGNGSYKLSVEKINQIQNEAFSIEWKPTS